MPKRIDLLRTALPACRRIALISNSRHPGEQMEIVACRSVIEPFAIQLGVYLLKAPGDLMATLAQAFTDGAQAILTLPSALMVRNATSIASACVEQRVPLISGWASMARSGALLTYGPNLEKGFGRLAVYALRVLDGTSPATLPIEQPTEFELVINLKTAAALGVAIPPTLLAQADELIE
jgi:putative ABC transport system substrate-binding protein